MNGRLINKVCLDFSLFKDDLKQHLLSFYGDNLLVALIFGSYAKGKQNETSDFDLFVILKACEDRPRVRLRSFTEPQGYSGPPINPVILTKNEFLAFSRPILLGLLDAHIVLNDSKDGNGQSMAGQLIEALKKHVADQGITKVPHKGGYYWKMPTKQKRAKI